MVFWVFFANMCFFWELVDFCMMQHHCQGVVVVATPIFFGKFHPDLFGEEFTNFDEHIIQMGWLKGTAT